MKLSPSTRKARLIAFSSTSFMSGVNLANSFTRLVAFNCFVATFNMAGQWTFVTTFQTILTWLGGFMFMKKQK